VVNPEALRDRLFKNPPTKPLLIVASKPFCAFFWCVRITHDRPFYLVDSSSHPRPSLSLSLTFFFSTDQGGALRCDAGPVLGSPWASPSAALSCADSFSFFAHAPALCSCIPRQRRILNPPPFYFSSLLVWPSGSFHAGQLWIEIPLTPTLFRPYSFTLDHRIPPRRTRLMWQKQYSPLFSPDLSSPNP